MTSCFRASNHAWLLTSHCKPTSFLRKHLTLGPFRTDFAQMVTDMLSDQDTPCFLSEGGGIACVLSTFTRVEFYTLFGICHSQEWYAFLFHVAFI